jgi:hypothetical protein
VCKSWKSKRRKKKYNEYLYLKYGCRRKRIENILKGCKTNKLEDLFEPYRNMFSQNK